MQRPLVFVAGAFIIGDLLAYRLSLSFAESLLALLLSGAFGLGFYVKKRIQAGSLLLLFFVLTGVLWTSAVLAQEGTRLQPFWGKQVTLWGTVVEMPKEKAGRVEFILQAEALEAQGQKFPLAQRVQGRLYGEPQEDSFSLCYGDRLMLRGKLERTLSGGNPGDFDYGQYLARQGIFAQITLPGPWAVEKVGQGGNSFLLWAYGSRERAEVLADATLSPEEGAIWKGILFGTQGELSPAQEEIFTITQTGHAFAVSGANVAFVILVAYGGFFYLLGWSRGLSLGATALILLFYATMTGWPPSVSRATVMGLLGLLAFYLQREKDFYTALAAAALGLLLWNPLLLYDAGFQLSFVATWGLVYFHPLVDRWLAFLPPWRQILVVPVAAQLAVAPLVAYYFNLVAPVGVVANVIAAGLIGAVMVLGLVHLPLVFFFPAAAQALILAGGVVIGLMEWVLGGLAQFPGAAFTVATPDLAGIFLYYLLLVVWREGPRPWLWEPWQRIRQGFLSWGTGKKLGALGLGAMLLLVILWPEKPVLRLTFLDVGQGDAILVETPGGRTMLVDGGGQPSFSRENFDTGEKVVLAYLRRQGIKKLDVVVNTHPHWDHVGGLEKIIEKMPVGLLVVGPFGSAGAGQTGTVPLAKGEEVSMQNLLAQAASRNIPVAWGRRGDLVALDGAVKVEILHPGAALQGTGADVNNNSLVLRLSFGERSFLLPGDLEREGMEEMLRNGGEWDADGYKLPHHGSLTGQHREFLQGLHPSVIVVSVGTNNFGHPHRETMEYWEQKGVTVFRTDQDGAVIWETDGSRMWIKNGKRGIRKEISLTPSNSVHYGAFTI